MNGRQMTRGAALLVILVANDRKNREVSRAEFEKLLRAFTALELTTDEMREACRHLGIANATGRTLNPELWELAPWRHTRQSWATRRRQE
jgi:hypothetical protein